MKVFVSYTLKDCELSIELLKKIKNYYDSYKINLYIDCLVNESSQEKIEYELKTSSRLLLILTKHTYNSEWVRKELMLAKKNNIPIIKAKLDEIFLVRF